MTLGRLSRGTVAALAAGAACVVALETSCRSASGRPATHAPSAPLDFAASVKAPQLRIGILTSVARTSIGADSGVIVGEAGGAAHPARMARATFVPAARDGLPRVRLIETGEEFEAAFVIPQDAADPSLAADATAYRGVFEVRAESARALTLVNLVNLEDYLRGVVPNELSPAAYPEIEALKAQAVAARTYALRNLGQFRSRGYDLCATAACQVYRGRSSEHPLSDQAVEETAGVTALYGGQLINALYTSTCGGHTEDGANVFEGEPQPYLRGVLCAPEKATWGSVRTGRPREPLGPEEGLGRDAALLEALGVVDAELATAKGVRGVATEVEVEAWTARLLAALHRKGCPALVEPPLVRRAGFFEHLVGVLCWEDRARRLLGPDEPDYLLQAADREGFAGFGERRAAALLIEEGALAAGPDNLLRPNTAISRAAAVQVLAAVLRRAGPPGLWTAAFRGAADGRLVVERDGADETFAVDSQVALFRGQDGRSAAAAEIALAPGDRLQLVVKRNEVIYLEAEQPRSGLASDRSSRYYRWETRLTPAEIRRSLARYGDVGEVKDIEIRRIGVSGRVVEAAVVGVRGEVALYGLKVRAGLGLRENLFAVDRELLEGGADVARFVFTGKGWGHGVGLCQVGAFGMAQAGASYERILKHYYSGITLERPSE